LRYPIILGADGNFYGTSQQGSGSNDSGAVFKITPEGALTILYNFTGGADGGDPVAGLVQAGNGNFYGTTYVGGANGYGTVFEMTRKGILTTLHTFSETDGAYPYAALAIGANGNLYGTTYGGGANHCSYNGLGCGTIFEITPAGSLTTLYSFTGGADQGSPVAGLVQANDGYLYGTTSALTLPNPTPFGTVFRIAPSGTLTTLHTFTGEADGGYPAAGLLQATNGDLYGTTSSYGALGGGTVYSLSLGLSQFVKTVPHSGKVGSPVIILGTDLTGATSVTFNGTPATYSVVSPTEITTTVPDGATSGQLVATTPSQGIVSGGPFSVWPVISSFSPASGPVGTPVTITGETLTGVTAVAFGGVPATSFIVNSYTRIAATVPVGAVTGAITVTSPSGIIVSSGQNFRVN
jgi:uncharacterized repeat protein (TIGR03803 family)